MDQSLTPSPSQGEMVRVHLAQQAVNSAKNFYWIAALSFINSIITAFGGEFYLVMGMATTIFVDYFAVGMAEEAPELKLIFTGVALVVSFIISAIAALFGYLAVTGRRWAFIVGMAFYAVDTLIVLVLQEWMGVLVHLFFLYALFTGVRALTQLRKLEPQAQNEFPKNIGMS